MKKAGAPAGRLPAFVFYAAIRGTLALSAPAGRADALKQQPVPLDGEAGRCRHLIVESGLIRKRRVIHRPAYGAEDVAVQVGAQIIPVGAGNPHVADLAVLRQTVQVAVYSAPADMLVEGMDLLVDLIGAGVVGVRADGLKGELPLLCFSSLLHFFLWF